MDSLAVFNCTRSTSCKVFACGEQFKCAPSTYKDYMSEWLKWSKKFFLTVRQPADSYRKLFNKKLNDYVIYTEVLLNKNLVSDNWKHRSLILLFNFFTGLLLSPFQKRYHVFFLDPLQYCQTEELQWYVDDFKNHTLDINIYFLFFLLFKFFRK